MEIFIEKQLISIVYSLILGLIFGAAYDIIRIIHIICGIASYFGGEKRTRKGVLPFVIFFLLDLLFVLAVIPAFSVFVYWTNYGDFRWYLIAGAALGFTAYYLTLGRVVMYFSETVVRFLRLVFHYTVAVPVRFIWRITSSAFRWVVGNTVGRVARYMREKYLTWRDRRYARMLRQDIRFSKKQ